MNSDSVMLHSLSSHIAILIVKPNFLSSLIAAAVISQLAACGQTGPLYLPPKPKAISTPAQPPAATQEKPAPATDSTPVAQ
jgi:predicted small lipoprotein YifL